MNLEECFLIILHSPFSCWALLCTDTECVRCQTEIRTNRTHESLHFLRDSNKSVIYPACKQRQPSIFANLDTSPAIVSEGLFTANDHRVSLVL